MRQPVGDVNERDRVLGSALQRREPAAIQELAERHGRWVRGVVFAALGDADLVEDVVQEVWLIVWQRAVRLEDPAKWKSWLFRLARNAAIDAGRRKQRQRRSLDQAKLFLPADLSGRAETEDPLVREEDRSRVRQAVEDLPEIYRQVLVLRHLEDWSYRQIAEVLSLPIATVETRLVRARKMLRKSLRREYGELGKH